MSNEQGPINGQSAQVAPTENLKTEPAQKTPSAEELFARKERQIRKMQEQVKRERETWEAQKRQYETDYMPKSRLKEDPLSVLFEAGYSHDDIAQRLLNSTPTTDPTIKALKDEIANLKKAMDEGRQAQETATNQQYEQALKQIDREVKLMVSSDQEF